MLRTHPSSIRFSLSPGGHDGDDHSELTGPSSTDYHWQNDDLLGNMATDPYYHNDFGGLLPSSAEKREILELKIQLARQQEKIESLSLKLRQCQDENEALEAERVALVDELTLVIKKAPAAKGGERPTMDSRPKDSTGPIRQLVDFNAALTAENARLQTIVDVTRKSFKTHIRESRRRRDEDKKTIEALRLRESELMRLRRGLSECKDLRHSSSTAETSLISSFTESAVGDSLGSAPVCEVDFGPVGGDRIAEGGEAEAARVRKRVPRAREMTVDRASSEGTKRALATRPRAPGSTGCVESPGGGAGGVPRTISFNEGRRSTARERSNIDW